MKKSSLAIVALFAVFFNICFFSTQASAVEKVYQMRGEITAIAVAYNTVVIEVPVGNKMFTVGGPLSSDAVLKKGGQPASLGDFAVGEQVTVRWTSTDKGHIIQMLKGR